MDKKLNVKIILASIREGRFGDKPAAWIFDIAKQNGAVSAELLDLKEYKLPLFAQKVSPKHVEGSYGDPAIDVWAAKIAEADAFIMVTPEYNNGYPSSLKNNIDYLYKEWGLKPVCFVSYGVTGGARAIQQLREVAIELQMAPISNSVNIFNPWNLTDDEGNLRPGVFDEHEKGAGFMLEQLVWWAKALKEARESGQ